ncbi:uncharacterized protein B0P05DRAFT_521042 [Gilbertella persicaria]|uniref:uncharacterized protein n=1 Tax=Gilbertella persicaria TaxID=101096 RepID=UPI002220EC07|nr:uncharacterized protein B0P05DRAFT_521042 [Gilbertella persicaria]KAI8098239.1 hypothetical protein B0P05DRAFT_521042 [Gilbertella persicaria]
MTVLKWGWVLHQKTGFRFSPSVWKKRYLVLTTTSIHVHKSEKGVISSLFDENASKIYVWSNYQAAKSQSTHVFMIEPRNSKLRTLKFKSSDQQEREKWLDVMNEQLNLTMKIWSSPQIALEAHLSEPEPTSSLPTGSVLDKWLVGLGFEKTSHSLTKEHHDFRDKGSMLHILSRI